MRYPMDTSDEIPLEHHRFFEARLDHLENCNPALLLSLLEEGTLTKHLRAVTARAMQTLGELVIHQNMPVDAANEMVMNQVVADPDERSRLTEASSHEKLQSLLERYRKVMPDLPRTYQSESETIE
jgi:hypothetical protein